MRKLILFSVLAAALIFAYTFDLQHMVTLQTLKEHRVELLSLKNRYPVSAAVCFIAAYVIVTVLAIPAKTILALAAGAIFGVVAGTVYTVIGATTGAIAWFLLARYVMRDLFRRKYGDRIEKLTVNLKEKGLSYLLLLRIVPLFPFVLVSIAAALVSLPLRAFAVGTFFGIIPASLLFNNAGASLAMISSTRDVMSPQVIVSLALIGILALVPAIKTWLE